MAGGGGEENIVQSRIDKFEYFSIDIVLLYMVEIVNNLSYCHAVIKLVYRSVSLII